MTKLLRTIMTSIERRLELAARNRARLQLLDRNDRFLEDAGLSRDLLEAGVHAWPWRVDCDAAWDAAAREGRRSLDRRIKRAIRELNAYSDRELADLGVSRADIPYAVIHGRPGIDAVARPASS